MLSAGCAPGLAHDGGVPDTLERIYGHSVAHGDYSLDVDFRYGITKYDRQEAQAAFRDEYTKIATIKTHMNLAIMRAVEEHGIKLALPLETHTETAGR